MKNKTLKIHAVFIKRMIISLVFQLIILGLVILFFRNYRTHNHLNIISDTLLIEDQYTLDKIGKYQILGSDYALNMELHNIGDMRKLDSIAFSKKNIIHAEEVMRHNKYLLYKQNDGEYIGVSTVSYNNKILGYIISTKKYAPVLPVSIKYDLFLIFLCIVSVFIINFGLLLLPIKKKIEQNTRNLLDFISEKKASISKIHSIDIEEYRTVASKFIDERNEITCLQKEKLYYEARKNIAEQVAHDMCSPLAAINIVMNGKQTFSQEEMEVIKSAATRLNYISNNLKSASQNESLIIKSESSVSLLQPGLIFLIVKGLISEKKYEYRDSNVKISLQIDDSACNAFSLINREELKTILSNLINNAVEATHNNGKILVQLRINKTEIEILITDNGKGIPNGLLTKVLEKGFSYEKKHGSGLGLYHATSQMNRIGGSLNIQSTVGVGTTVICKMSEIDAPAWFCQNIELQEKNNIVILDDDPFIHQTWNLKLKPFKNQIINYYCSSEILLDSNKLDASNIYLIDYQLFEDDKTGIDIINTLSLHPNVVLVTNNYEDDAIILSCEKLNIKILPKPLIEYVPVIKSKNIHLKSRVF